MDRPIPHVKLAVGLPGGTGSGKTTDADFLGAPGATVVDTDAISPRLTAAGGAVMAQVREAFGAEFVTHDGALDRAAMRSLVFSDAAARARLEAILHPAIRREADRELAGATGAYSVVVIPLLFETRASLHRVDRVLVVDCPEALQVRRTATRSGLAEDAVRRIMAAQWPRWRRLQMADDLAWNGGDEAGPRAPCAALHQTPFGRGLAHPTNP